MGPHGTVPRPVLDAIFPASLKRRARNVVLRERAGDTDTRNNYGHRPQPLRCLVHSHPPVVAKLGRWRSWAGGEAEPVAKLAGGAAAAAAGRGGPGPSASGPGHPQSGPGHPQSGEYNALLIALHPMAAISLPIPRAGSPLVAV